jgi:ferric-dicitrate binding protein FerR (iron transport regulator)
VKSDPNVTARALARVVAEARAESAPELDWDRVEARLGQEPRLPLVDSAPARGMRVGWFLAAAGVALALGWHAAGGRVHATVTAAAPSSDKLDGNTLAGSSLEATQADVSVEHAGHSQWTLERGSRARVMTHDGVVEVVLERGSVKARVVPSPRSETFVVEAAGTRVAVHGTVFRVALSGDHVDVAVTEGTVLVGPREKPGSGRPVTARESSSFTLGGELIAPERPSARPAHLAGEHHGTPSAAPMPALPAQPPIDEVEKVVSKVLDVGASCFERNTATANGVRVTVNTTMTLKALPSGNLELANFDPPLAPAVQRCLEQGIRSVTIAESQQGISIVRRMDLER